MLNLAQISVYYIAVCMFLILQDCDLWNYVPLFMLLFPFFLGSEIFRLHLHWCVYL